MTVDVLPGERSHRGRTRPLTPEVAAVLATAPRPNQYGTIVGLGFVTGVGTGLRRPYVVRAFFGGYYVGRGAYCASAASAQESAYLTARLVLSEARSLHQALTSATPKE